jgi:hypothetical protein
MRGQFGEVVQSSGANRYGKDRQRLKETLEFFNAGYISVYVPPEYERLPSGAFAFQAFLCIAPSREIGILIGNNDCALAAEEGVEDISSPVSNAGFGLK